MSNRCAFRISARAAKLGLDDANDFLQLRGGSKRSDERKAADAQPSVPLVGSRFGSLVDNE